MDRPTLLRKLTELLDEFERNRTFGSIELCFNRGQVELIRKLTTQKFYNKENTYGGREER